MPLYNRKNGKELKARLRETHQERTTISFYKYQHILDPKTFRDELYSLLVSVEVLGRIYVAQEGINAQISVPTSNLGTFEELLYSISFLNGVRLNSAVDDDGKSFFKLKILVRHKMIIRLM
jgi:UPF0176 protein